MLNHRGMRRTQGTGLQCSLPAFSTLPLALLATIMAAAILSPIARGASQRRARDARALNVTDTAHLRYIRESGSLLIEEGVATGGLPGTVKVRFDVGPTVTSSFTIYTRGGSIAGNGSGVLHGTGVTASFGGTMTVSHGTGRYAHAHGRGGFYGTINRKTYALTVQTTGTLSY
jgi:hypothetical protein